jgi:hypothetical protein
MSPDNSVSDRTFVVYVTFSDTEFYIGKSSQRRINEGYQGSGSLILAKLKAHPDTFSTEILVSGLTEVEAYAVEALLVPVELIGTDGCLNLTPGGGLHADQVPGVKISRAQKISQTRKERMKDPAFKEMYKRSFTKARNVVIENYKKTPYIIDGVPIFMSSPEFTKVKAFLKNYRYYIVKHGDRHVIEDRGFYLDGVRYNRKSYTDELGISLSRIKWDGRIGSTRPCYKTGTTSNKSV